MIKVIGGRSNIDEIKEDLVKKEAVSIVCGKCSKPLLREEKKVIVGSVVYCDEDALCAAKQMDKTLHGVDAATIEGKLLFNNRLLVCRISGLRNLHIYPPSPGSN